MSSTAGGRTLQWNHSLAVPLKFWTLWRHFRVVVGHPHTVCKPMLNIAFKVPSIFGGKHASRTSEERVPFDTSSIRLCSCHQRCQDGGTDSLWNLVNGTCFFNGKFPTGKQDHLFKIPLESRELFSGTSRKTCVPGIFLVNGKRPIKQAHKILGSIGFSTVHVRLNFH